MATSNQRLTVRHPYAVPGALLAIVAIVLIAFDLGALARCGQGEGVCFDLATHGVSDGALVLFFVLFVIGIVLVMYTTADATVTTVAALPAQAGSGGVTIVNPPANPPTSQVNVNPRQ